MTNSPLSFYRQTVYLPLITDARPVSLLYRETEALFWSNNTDEFYLFLT